MASDFKFLNAKVPNEYYYSKELFDNEQVEVFQKSWYFVGITDTIQNHNDFISLEIGKVSVVIQNFKGTLKAFHNVCTHRFNKIQIQECGNRPLLCQYHGWNYNKDGIPFGIPLKSEFDSLDSESLQKLCLKQFRIDTCGKFIFVNIIDNGLSLLEYLDESAENLLEISGMLGKKIESNAVFNNANWKVVVENTLEGYHISTVHPHTFYKQGFNLKSEVSFEIFGKHTNMLLQVSETAEPNKNREKLYKMLKDRPFKPNGFFHQLIFPNLSIGSLFGITAYIGSLEPNSETSSNFKYQLYETNLGEGVFLNEALSEVIGASAAEFTLTTLSEDKEICENVQKGLQESNAIYGVLNSQEKRIWEFHKTYAQVMDIK